MRSPQRLANNEPSGSRTACSPLRMQNLHTRTPAVPGAFSRRERVRRRTKRDDGVKTTPALRWGPRPQRTAAGVEPRPVSRRPCMTAVSKLIEERADRRLREQNGDKPFARRNGRHLRPSSSSRPRPRNSVRRTSHRDSASARAHRHARRSSYPLLPSAPSRHEKGDVAHPTSPRK